MTGNDWSQILITSTGIQRINQVMDTFMSTAAIACTKPPVLHCSADECMYAAFCACFHSNKERNGRLWVADVSMLVQHTWSQSRVLSASLACAAVIMSSTSSDLL